MQKTIFLVRQWGTKFVYSTRLGMNAYKLTSAIKAKRRKVSRGISRWIGKAEPVLSESIGPLRNFRRYQQEYAKVPGWFLDEAQAAWDSLLTFQADQSIEGNMLEIGVWKGKSAALAALHARAKETCVWLDRMILAEFEDTINSIRKTNNLFLQHSSVELPGLKQVSDLGQSFRWIHIDGEHSGEAVTRDLAAAEGLLSENGIICIDDFPSCAYPQINFAVIEYLSQHPALSMIACGHNKGYICRQEYASTYLDFIKNDLHREMSARGVSVTIWKSGRKADWNCFGITDRVEMFDYRGPDWNPSKIEV